MTQRRSIGGARREATERVEILREGFSTEAWTLNKSRGGLRLVVLEPLTVGVVYQVHAATEEGERSAPARACSVVWVRDEPDGQIAGLRYLDESES